MRIFYLSALKQLFSPLSVQGEYFTKLTGVMMYSCFAEV